MHSIFQAVRVSRLTLSAWDGGGEEEEEKEEEEEEEEEEIVIFYWIASTACTAVCQPRFARKYLEPSICLRQSYSSLPREGTYFTFDGAIYEQLKGTPTGSPISGFMAEAVLQRLESLDFQHHRPKFWARYVDDTFVVIERDQVLTFKERLNSVFPDIQFTLEEEENNQLAFLDVLICRKDCGGLKTKVFRKATNTTQILNFSSNHSISYKRRCLRTLYPRVVTHCSEPEDKVAEDGMFIR
nr:unnamed protein product [Spirometra erinaceieuropaei]